MDIGAELEKEREKSRVKAFRASSAVKHVAAVERAVWGKTDPNDYSSIYPIKTKLSGTSLEGAFLNGNATHGNALLSRRSLPIFPGMRSFDEDYLKFLRGASMDLDRLFPKDVDDEKFTATGLYASFSSLRCPAGYFQTPMSYTTVDNEKYREELGLQPGYSPRQHAIATEFWRLIFSEAVACPVNVAKKSTGGMRRFSSSVQWKLDFANFITQPENFERMLNAIAHGDALTLANEFEMIFATYIQKRGQVDRADKIRYVFDLDYALSGGTVGKPFPTDKEVFLHGVKWDDFSAIRARVVHAGPWTINCFLQMVASPTMRAMFARFPDTFHVNTLDEIKQRVDGKDIYASDVTEYDRSMSRDAIAVPHDVMKEFWDERIVTASWKLFTAPYFAKPLGLESGKGTWVKNPLIWTDEVFAGNRSGHALTSLIAKGNKVVESLFIVDKMYPVLGRVASFLRHEQPIKLINNGDDEIVLFDVEQDKRRFLALRQDKSNGHYVVEQEEGCGYSGSLILKTTEDKVYKPTPRIHTALQKMFVPERGIDSPQREFWPIGMNVRVANITATDLGREVWDVTLHHYRNFLAPRHGELQALIAKGTEEMSIRIDGLTDVDREVLDDPDKLHYKWLPEEVSSEVMQLVTSRVPQARVETILGRYYSGHIR